MGRNRFEGPGRELLENEDVLAAVSGLVMGFFGFSLPRGFTSGAAVL